MIHAERLRKVFEGTVAVEEVSLEVGPGEIVALLGPNGAGKTTTVRMLAALLRPTGGWAQVAGFDVVRHPQEVRRRVGLLTELPGLYPRMTGREFLAFFADLYEVPRSLLQQRLEPWLGPLGLREALDRRIATYSKGMRQKLALLRAFLQHPPVLLLDEPTSAMDPESAWVVREMIRRLAEDGAAVLLCTHNLHEAEALAHRIVVLHRGRVRVAGSPTDLRRRLLGPPVYEVRFAGPLEITPEALPSSVTVVEVSPGRLRYQVQDPERENPALLAALLDRGIPVVALSEIPRSLEEVYLRILREPDPREDAGDLEVHRPAPVGEARAADGEGSGLTPRRWLWGVWTVFRRDLLDILRDWRMVTPLVLLLLIIPLIAISSADAAARYVAQFGAQVVGERLLPFLALFTGFLPLTTCLVIPLEIFVGEKERRTMEPLLAVPLSDLQLYLGKGLAALVVPVAASWLGLTFYLGLLVVRRVLAPDLLLFGSLYLTLGMHGLMMVAGAIVVSTQSHSVRGANLLSSFIIMPVSMLMVLESVLLFWNSYRALLVVQILLLAYTVLLVRMGVVLFNRERLLSSEFDTLGLREILRDFWRALREGDPERPASGWWGHIAGPVQRSLGALATLGLLGGMGLGIGWRLAFAVPSQEPLGLRLSSEQLSQLLSVLTPWGIFLHNVRALLVNTFFSVATLGMWAAAYPVGLMGLIGLLLGRFFRSGPAAGMAGLLAVFPHGVLELPAAGLVLAGALRLGLVLLTPPGNRSLRERWLLAAADWVKLLGIALPLLLIAAWIEARVTPSVILLWLSRAGR